MFYCDPCGAFRQWPETAFKSYGQCEVCGQNEPCNEVSSQTLEQLPHITESLKHPETYQSRGRPQRKPS